MELFYQFIEGVADGTILSCEKVRQAVQRHYTDFEKSKDESYPYVFDEEIAARSLKILGLLRHTAGDYEGEFFRITPIQAFITAQLFGWVKKSDGKRKYKKSYLEVPRKWGKSEYIAALMVIFGLFDGENGAQMITAATKLPQCKYVFKPMKRMLRKLIKDHSDELEGEIKINEREVTVHESGNVFFMLSADAAKEDGANPHFAAVDELHAHPNGDLLKVIETGTMARSQSLVFMITTAGFNRYSICRDQRDTVANILSGLVENDRYFGMICELDEDDDWQDPALWKKANPHIDVTVPMENMMDAYTKAMTEGPEAVREFKVKNLNIWEDSADPWVTLKEWNNCGDATISLADYWGKKCVAGLDMSSTEDITALCLIFPPQEGIENPVYFFRFYCPATKVQSFKRKDGVDYRRWIKDGHMNMTPGNSIDQGYIKNDILRIATNHKLTILEFDRYNADNLIQELTSADVNCNDHRQTPTFMNPPVRRMYKLIQNHPENYKDIDDELKEYLENKAEDEAEEWETKEYMIHDANPVMGWMITNIEVLSDSNANIKFSKNSVKGGGKKKSNNKVDGPVAAAMATTAYMFPPDDNISAYENQELVYE